MIAYYVGESDQVLWQSFDHIGDTWLPGAKLRRDKLSAVIQQGMTSWRSRGDPAPGGCGPGVGGCCLTWGRRGC